MIRFRLFGIPFEIGTYFWIGSAIFGSNLAVGEHALLNLALWVACVLVSIVVHELGHALAARHYGVQPTVLLHGIGGLTFFPGARLTRPQSILVSLAGPAAGFGLWGLVVLAQRAVYGSEFFHDDNVLDRYVMYSVIRNLVFINFTWTIFNLLPILPLDGGQVMRDVLGPLRLSIALAISATCAAGLCVYMALQGQYYLAFFLGALAVSNYRGNSGNFLGGVRRR